MENPLIHTIIHTPSGDFFYIVSLIFIKQKSVLHSGIFSKRLYPTYPEYEYMIVQKCVCVHVCTYVYVCMHVCTYVHACVCMCVLCEHVCVCVLHYKGEL